MNGKIRIRHIYKATELKRFHKLEGKYHHMGKTHSGDRSSSATRTSPTPSSARTRSTDLGHAIWRRWTYLLVAKVVPIGSEGHTFSPSKGTSFTVKGYVVNR